jgi:hypothetical protein
MANIRSVLKTVTEAASAGAAKSGLPMPDVEGLLGQAFAGMDAVLLRRSRPTARQGVELAACAEGVHPDDSNVLAERQATVDPGWQLEDPRGEPVHPCAVRVEFKRLNNGRAAAEVGHRFGSTGPRDRPDVCLAASTEVAGFRCGWKLCENPIPLSVRTA